MPSPTSSKKKSATARSARKKIAAKPKAVKPQLTLAEKADKYALYERSVQAPENEVSILAEVFKRYKKRPALSLREDFCGTGLVCAEWVKQGPKHKALGIDLDPEPLAYGRAHHVEVLPREQAKRVSLVQADVRDGVGPKTDLVCALNFSYFLFKTRAELLAYFRGVRAVIAKNGAFILDVYGGLDAMGEDRIERKIGRFVYTWDQATFSPLTHESRCYIHFSFSDGSALNRAFAYDWRLWTIPELRDVLADAGFRNVRVLWDKADAKGNATGRYYEPKTAEMAPRFWTYIFAEP